MASNPSAVSFNFTESGYIAPAGGDIAFAFRAGRIEITAPPAVFYAQAVVLTVAGSGYTISVTSPPAKFYYQGSVGYIDSYKPPVPLTDFVNMTNARRDKAISYDKQHTFDMGPVARTDISEGLMARAWRLRIDGTDVYLAVSDEQNSKWEAEFKEFTLPHYPVSSMDLTFDQNGRPFACWEFEGMVYIYWHDPLLEDMDVKYICAGRTPRARLDARERHQLPDSDIYLFYINDSVDHLEYRIQRDGYEYAYHAPIMTQKERAYTPSCIVLGNLVYVDDTYVCMYDDSMLEDGYAYMDGRIEFMYEGSVLECEYEGDPIVTEEEEYKSTKNLYLEVLSLARNWRLYIWMSEYLPENEGTHSPAYQLVFRHSAIYPYYVLENMEVRRDQIAWGEHSEYTT